MPSLTTSTTPLKPIFVIVVGIGLVLTAVALFTPAWRVYQNNGGNNNPNSPIYSSTTFYDGLVTNNCADQMVGQCGISAPWETNVTVLVVVALALEVLILIWAVMSYAPFCRPPLHYPLPVFCLVVTAALVVALVIFGVNYSYYQGGTSNFAYNYQSNPQQMYNQAGANTAFLGNYSQVTIGVSYFLAIAATVVMAIATALAGAIVANVHKER